MTNATFAGSVPEIYERYLGPLLFEPFARDLVHRVDACAGAALLELACGTGLLTRELLRVAPRDVALTATDLSEPMLSVAGGLVNDSRATLRKADAMALPFDAASFDAALCQFGVMFFPDKAAAAAQVRRVLRPGGKYIFNSWGSFADNPLADVAERVVEETFPDNPPRFFHTPWGYPDADTIAADARRGGFADVRVETVDVLGRAPSAEAAAIGLTQGTPMAGQLAERTPDAIRDVTARMTAAFAREFGAAPLVVPMRAYVVTCS
jgi:SAM-dependent methyltransferase